MIIVKSKNIENMENTEINKLIKTGVEDRNLSWTASGLLKYILNYPSILLNSQEIFNIRKNEIRASKNALKELTEENYCHCFELKNENEKVIQTFYLFFGKQTVYSDTVYQEMLEKIEKKKGITLSYKKIN